MGCSKVLVDKTSSKTPVRDCWFSDTAVLVPAVVGGVVDVLHMTVMVMMTMKDIMGKRKSSLVKSPLEFFFEVLSEENETLMLLLSSTSSLLIKELPDFFSYSFFP